jgi:hypothetical protein
MWVAVRALIDDRLFPGSLFRHSRLILSCLAHVPDRGYRPDGSQRLALTTAADSTLCAHIDLPEPDSVLYLRTLAAVF